MRRIWLSCVALACILFSILTVVVSPTYGLERMTPLSFRIGVISGESIGESVSHISELLRHLGYPFDVILDRVPNSNLLRYSLLIILESGLEKFAEDGSSTLQSLAKEGKNLMWIGPGIRLLNNETLTEVFGIRFVAETPAENLGIAYASSNSSKTKIFLETVTHVELNGAKAEGYFTDESSKTLFPSESQFKRGFGVSYFFAYDVSAWWNVDTDSPWSRPASLVSALRLALSDTPTVRMLPYPRNLRAAYVCRIEDVDPLHTSSEWLSRAQRYLEEYHSNAVPLSVSLIPYYLDPENGLRIPLGADSAEPLGKWLRSTMNMGGAIAQHGYTHQSGLERTGVGREFLVNGTWMPYEEQLRRISLGKTEIEDSLQTKIFAFEPPHYKFNEDTVTALKKVGFRYLFDDPSSPFLGLRFSEGNDQRPLAVIPETLGYIPLQSSADVESRLEQLVDQLLAMEGILLLYNHLYGDSAFAIGVRMMQYILQEGKVWTPNANEIGEFTLGRAKSHARFNVTIGSDVAATLGQSTEKGLTLEVTGIDRITRVQVNGREWALFGSDYVILPEMPQDINTVIISFASGSSRQPFSFVLGLGLLGVVTSVAFPLARRVFGEDL